MKKILLTLLISFSTLALSAQSLYLQWDERLETYIVVDENGNRIKEYGFLNYARNFSEGLASVKFNKKWGYIDKNGKFVIEPIFDDAGSFSEGLAGVKIDRGWGYIDKNGDFVIRPSYYYASCFFDGIALVKMYNVGWGEWIYIDKTGKCISSCFDDAASFSEGFASFKYYSRWGAIDKTFKHVIEPTFKYAFHFSEGIAAVNIDDKYGYIDKTGKFVIEPVFDDAGSFSEGLAAVKINDKYGYIDKTGKFVIEPVFDDAGSFSEGLADVEIDDKRGYIDKTGKVVIEPAFHYARRFSEGLATVGKYYDSRFFIDKTGNIVKFFPGYGILKETLAQYIDDKLGSMEDYFTKADFTPPSEEAVVEEVRQKIEKWQTKDEFESTAQWQARVNEQSRQAKARQLADSISQTYAKRSAELAKNYNTQYANLVNEFCNKKGQSFAKQNFTLQPYDADNEVYLISSDLSGDFLLPVPRSEARNFKENWDSIRQSVKANFVPSGNDVVLSTLSFDKYTYDSHTKAEYARVEIDYNFRPIDAGALNYNFATLEQPTPLSMPKATTAQPAATGRNVAQPETRRITAGNASDVDLNIPQTDLKNDNTFALIIANANYANASKVENARNDGNVMAQYFQRTLGIPANNITLLHDATYGQIASAINHLGDIAAAFGPGKFNLMFYYVGHGLPDETNHESFILPVDVDPKNTEICYSLDKVYSTLGAMQANTVTVMVDACFSGSNYGSGMLNAQAMGARIKAKVAAPRGNMIIISAAQGDETAYPYAEQGHGLFTYWLLKKLQLSKGKVTLGELADYITDNVRKTSVVVNRKAQTPTIAVSSTLTDTWQNRQFAQ